MTTELLASIAPGAPLLAAMATTPRSPSVASTRTAPGGAALAVGAALLLLLTAPATPAPALFGLLVHDRPGAMIALLAATIALLVLVFAGRAFGSEVAGARFARRAAALTGATITLALAGNIVVLVLAWLAVGVLLTMLLDQRRGPAAREAVRTTRRLLLVGDGALLIALVLVLATAGPIALKGAMASATGALEAVALPGLGALTLLDLVAVLLVVAAMSRSALVPLHRWLPSTLAAPTPVSALLHAGVVNGAGVLLLATAPILGAAPLATALAFASGAATALLATAVMLVRADVKGGLAWSTAGQMGFMVVQIAIGAFGAALFHLIGHGLYKAAAFLGAGDAISAHARARHRPASSAVPSPRARGTAVVLLPTLGLAVAWWVLDPGFAPAKAVLFLTVAWLMTASLVAGWLRTAPLGVLRSTLAAAVVAPGLAVGYLGAIVGFERLVAGALPTSGPAAIGVWPVALVIAVAALASLAVAASPEGALLRVRVHAWLTGRSIRPLPLVVSGSGAAPRGAGPGAATAPVRTPVPHAHSVEVLR